MGASLAVGCQAYQKTFDVMYILISNFTPQWFCKIMLLNDNIPWLQVADSPVQGGISGVKFTFQKSINFELPGPP